MGRVGAGTKRPEHERAHREILYGTAGGVGQFRGANGRLGEAQFANAIEAIAKRDGKLAETAIGTDDRVDRIQQTIEDQALKLLALRQPMAVDLRTTLPPSRSLMSSSASAILPRTSANAP